MFLDALAEFGLVGVLALLAGSIGFAAASLLGRGVGAGMGGGYLFGSYAVNGYSDIVPGFGVLRWARCSIGLSVTAPWPASTTGHQCWPWPVW